ncbi:hypothetical protein WICPIJ_009180 [Wickerhamomyces pijperi]|uniref:Uncharacterized protein n=1 Tax=Wickerhamomyces pijperi TaxID=599730 RepID=A0A9P8TF26_WICPI|nr:hypothetical protein WICPIJ_009180 [Wickerhamomyces pijperi]
MGNLVFILDSFLRSYSIGITGSQCLFRRTVIVVTILYHLNNIRCISSGGLGHTILAFLVGGWLLLSSSSSLIEASESNSSATSSSLSSLPLKSSSGDSSSSADPMLTSPSSLSSATSRNWAAILAFSSASKFLTLMPFSFKNDSIKLCSSLEILAKVTLLVPFFITISRSKVLLVAMLSPALEMDTCCTSLYGINILVGFHQVHLHSDFVLVGQVTVTDVLVRKLKGRLTVDLEDDFVSGQIGVTPVPTSKRMLLMIQLNAVTSL